MYKAAFLFGKEEINKFLNEERLSKDELVLNTIYKEFNTCNEAKAFIDGVETAVGWTECMLLSKNDLNKLKKEGQQFSV